MIDSKKRCELNIDKVNGGDSYESDPSQHNVAWSCQQRNDSSRFVLSSFH